MRKTSKQSIAGTSCWLRAVQRGFADESESRQMEHLGEELDKLLEEIPYGERRAFLEALLKRFPVWQSDPYACVAKPGGTEEMQSASDEPLHLAETLARRLPSLGADEKEAVLSLLREVVTDVPAIANAPTEQQVADLRSSLRLPADATLHPERIGALANHLVQLVIKLEQLTGTVWTKVAARSVLRPPRHVEQTAGRFLSEDGRDGAELVKELRLLLEFITAIMTAASRVAEAVGGRYARKFSPEAIQALVEMEPKRLANTLISSKGDRCWRKYCELAETLSAEHIEKEIESTMMDCAEAFVKGLERLG